MFLKKITIVIMIIIISLISSVIFILLKNIYKFNNDMKTVNTFLSTSKSEEIYIDLNGDGKKDVLYISSSNDQYTISSNINGTNYQFNPKSPISTLGKPNEYWPATIKFIDLSRDKIPEIIIQSSENSVAIFHIFKWTGSEFKDIYCSTNEIFGIIDSNNNKSPKFISFSLNNNIEDIQKYMVLNNNVKNISYENLKVPAYNTVNEFINIITLPYNLYNLPGIFSEDIPYSLIHQLDILNKEDFYYVFQDGFFKDINWNEENNISEVHWILRFRKSSKKNNLNSELLEWDLTLKNIGSEKFIITNLKKADSK